MPASVEVDNRCNGLVSRREDVMSHEQRLDPIRQSSPSPKGRTTRISRDRRRDNNSSFSQRDCCYPDSCTVETPVTHILLSARLLTPSPPHPSHNITHAATIYIHICIASHLDSANVRQKKGIYDPPNANPSPPSPLLKLVRLLLLPTALPLLCRSTPSLSPLSASSSDSSRASPAICP